MAAVRAANLAVRFLVELAALGIVAYWGLNTWTGQAAQMLFGVGAPVALAVVWALLASPQAPAQLSEPTKVSVQMALLGVPVLALMHLGKPALAAGFALAIVVNAVLMVWWHQ